MLTPIQNWRELRRVSRLITAILLLVGGLVVIFEAALVDWLPRQDQFLSAQARVLSKDQRGTFRDPAFSITLGYTVVTDGIAQEIRSGKRLPFEVYYVLAVGDVVQIHYNPQNAFDWRLDQRFRANTLNDYTLGVVMLSLGVLWGIFPWIVRLASRADEFEELDTLDYPKEERA